MIARPPNMHHPRPFSATGSLTWVKTLYDSTDTSCQLLNRKLHIPGKDHSKNTRFCAPESSLPDHLVRLEEEYRRNRETQRLSSLYVED